MDVSEVIEAAPWYPHTKRERDEAKIAQQKGGRKSGSSARQKDCKECGVDRGGK